MWLIFAAKAYICSIQFCLAAYFISSPPGRKPWVQVKMTFRSIRLSYIAIWNIFLVLPIVTSDNDYISGKQAINCAKFSVQFEVFCWQ